MKFLTKKSVGVYVYHLQLKLELTHFPIYKVIKNIGIFGSIEPHSESYFPFRCIIF